MNNILNNLWIALSTPNEELIRIVSIPLLFFIEMPLSFYLICNTFHIKYSTKQKFIYVISTTIAAIIANFCLPWPFNIIINYLCAFIVLFFVMKLSFIKAAIGTIFPSIIFNLVVALLGSPYLRLLSITYKQNNTIFIYRIPFAILTYLIVTIIDLVIKYNKKLSIDVLDNLDKNTKMFIFLNLAFGIFSILLQGIFTVRYSDSLPLDFAISNFMFLLIYVLLSFYTLIKVTNLVKTEQELENAEEYNKTLHILYDNVRGFKHDFDNIVTAIGGYIKTNDMEGLAKYYSQLEEDCSKVNNLYTLNPDIINNPCIYNLLTVKYNDAIEKGIKVNLTFLLNLDNLNMKIYEFARILGILLDNAIDAVKECDEKILNIVFRDESKNKRNIILIENTYKDKNINTDKIFEKGVSGKKDHTGLGLWEVRKILNKTTNANLFTSKDEKYFKQQIEIYY